MYVVIDTTFPSHIINDCSLFTTYMPGQKVHCTVFGYDIIIEGTGDAHIWVCAGGQYIYFHMWNCWHVPTLSHHFLSCATITSSGYQVMITAWTPRILFPNNCHLLNGGYQNMFHWQKWMDIGSSNLKFQLRNLFLSSFCQLLSK